MKSLTAFLLSLVCVAPLAEAQSRRDVVPPNALRRPTYAIAAAKRRTSPAPSVTAAPRAAVLADVIPTVCPEPNSVCGYVQVPLDRKHPQGTKIGMRVPR